MTRATIKRKIHEAIDQVESDAILSAIHLILSEEVRQSKAFMKAFSLEEFYKRHETSQKQIKQGKLIGQKAVKTLFRNEK